MDKVHNFRTGKKISHKLKDHEQFKELASAVCERISFDEDLNLPYGFSFDHYVLKKKAKIKAKEGSEAKKRLWEVYHKLQVKSDLELVKFYRHAVAEKNKVKNKQKE